MRILEKYTWLFIIVIITTAFLLLLFVPGGEGHPAAAGEPGMQPDLLGANGSNSSGFTSAYIVSTYPGQSQQLYASAGQSGVLMYPYWNITLESSYASPVNYTVYIDGTAIANGTMHGIQHVAYHVQLNMVTVEIILHHQAFRFTNLPISSIPLRQLYSPPPPPLIYTQAFLNIFKIRTMAAAALSIIAAVMIAGRMTVAKQERTITG